MPEFKPIANVKGLTKKRRYRLTKQFRKDWPRAIGEGDSWFEYRRDITAQYDTIDQLGGVSFPYAIYPLAEAGAELAEMLEEKEWVDKIQSVEPSFILFSGGGNDILGKPLKTILVDRKKLGINKSTAIASNRIRKTLIDEDKLKKQIEGVRDSYLEIIRLTNEVKSGIPIVVHGYDYPIPNGKKTKFRLPGLHISVKGPWLKNTMEGKNITSREEREGIVKVLINDFNEMLKDLASQQAQFFYVNCRGTLESGDWADEIHPNTKGFRKIAEKIDRSVRRAKLI